MSQCSSRKARTEASAFSGELYSESMLHILLNSLAEWSDGARARIYIPVLSSLYNVLAPLYTGASRREARITLSRVSKEKRRTENAEGADPGSEVRVPAAASFTLFRRFRNSSAPWSFSSASRFRGSESPDGVNFENRVSSSSGSSTFVMIRTIESA